MDITVSKIHFNEQRNQIRVTVYYSEQVGEAFHSAEVTVFIDAVDSYAEMKRLALEKAKTFLLLATSDH